MFPNPLQLPGDTTSTPTHPTSIPPLPPPGVPLRESQAFDRLDVWDKRMQGWGGGRGEQLMNTLQSVLFVCRGVNIFGESVSRFFSLITQKIISSGSTQCPTGYRSSFYTNNTTLVSSNYRILQSMSTAHQHGP